MTAPRDLTPWESPARGSGAAAKVLRGALKDAAWAPRGGLVLGPHINRPTPMG